MTLHFLCKVFFFYLKSHLAEYLTDGKTSLFFFLSFILLLIFPYSPSKRLYCVVCGLFLSCKFREKFKKKLKFFQEKIKEKILYF